MAEKRLRVGLVGAGRVAARHLEALAHVVERMQLVAVCDSSAVAGLAAAGRGGVAESSVYTDVEGMLAAEKPDAVIICTPHDRHFSQAMLAVERGVHVLVEKPLAGTMEECREIVAAAERAGVVLMVGSNQRFGNKAAALRERIEAGELGRITAIRAEASVSVAGLAKDHWIFDGKQSGGGVMMSLGVQMIDLMRFTAGEIRTVWRALMMRKDARFTHRAEASAVAELVFENGAAGELSVNFTGDFHEEITVIGDRGMMTGTHAATLAAAPLVNSFAAELRHFSACVRLGHEPISSGRDACKTMGVVFAVYEAERRNGAVEVEGRW